jgi:hypothetical protein
MRTEIEQRVSRCFMASRGLLKVGDRVLYADNFGRGRDNEVTVTSMELAASPKSKSTITELKKAPWELINDNWILITIKYDEGASSWGYGFQFKPA